MRKFITLAIVIVLLLGTAVPAMAATSQNVTVTATPSFISITNSPGTFDFGVISESSTPNTTTGYFGVTNDSTVAIDVNIGCDGWSGTTPWTYGAAGTDTGQLNASATNGGVGGSTGAGNYDVTVPDGSTALLCDALAATTDFDWELELEAPASFTHGDQQTTVVTITAVAD
jgi:hypothetical protein